jgi:hypothetical protein
MAHIDRDDLDGVSDGDMLDDDIGVRTRADRDGVQSLHDVEAEAGDDEATDDAYDMDDKEARELGVQLDDRDEPEPGLD